MASAVLIVQGEGRGHLSQAMALKEYLEEAGHEVKAALVGGRTDRGLPDYAEEAFGGMLHRFHSPFLLKTPNQKGIRAGRSILANLLLSFRYLSEVRRIRHLIGHWKPDVVFNFYDLVGALALRKAGTGTGRIGIGHHFLLHMEGYRCPGRNFPDRWMLKLHTRLIMRSCDRVLALSFRETSGQGKTVVFPPLIRRQWRELRYRPGEHYVSYLMSGGYLYDLVRMARDVEGFRADVFTDLVPEMELPEGIRLHRLSGPLFREKLAGCRGLITTAGFDTVAEAAYHGIPLLVIPARNHFEQRCNAADAERSGIGIAAAFPGPHQLAHMKPSDPATFRTWAGRAGAMLGKMVEAY